MWRNPGVDTSDFFNFGLDEEGWKDYCKLMQALIQVRRFGQNKITEDESSHSLEDGKIVEVEHNGGNDESLPSTDSKDQSFCDSDVIIKIAMHDSSSEREIIRQHIKEDGELTDDEDVKLHSDSEDTPKINCMMINGDKILPFPMDSFSAEDREWKEEQSQKYSDALLITHSEVEQRTFRKRGDYSRSHVGQGSQKKFRFCRGNQASHNNVDLDMAESLCSPRMESVREKIENYVSDGEQKESASRVVSTNSRYSKIKMRVEDSVDINGEEDRIKLKRRRQRFKLSFAKSKEYSYRYINADRNKHSSTGYSY